MSLFALEAVSVALDGRSVLRNVSLALRRGEVLGLVGGNGAGKTTLLRAAAGSVPLASGRILFRGEDAVQLSRNARALALAVVPQDTRVPFPFTALEIVLMGRAPHLHWLGFESQRDLDAAHAAMQQLGIEGLAARSVLELSGGERQLVMVARAFAQQADVLLLDEATAHLDLRHRARVLARVRGAVRSGTRAALVVSHDLDWAARYCDRLALLAEGELLVLGDPVEVLTRANLQRAYGVEIEIARGPDGLPLVVPSRGL